MKDLITLLPRFKELGLEVNSAKCEVFPCSAQVRATFSSFSAVLPGLRILSEPTFNLLGSPIFPAAIPDAQESIFS